MTDAVEQATLHGSFYINFASYGFHPLFRFARLFKERKNASVRQLNVIIGIKTYIIAKANP